MEMYSKITTGYYDKLSGREGLETFKRDLFEDFEVSNNSRKDRAFELAWDRGHSCGYTEVYNCFADLVGLIKD